MVHFRPDVICFPKGNVECAEDRERRLRNAGIVDLVSCGSDLIGDFKVLGKGHASVVVLAQHMTLGEVAIKLLRTDSKREDLFLECRFMQEAEPISPKPYVCENDFIIMEFLDGKPLKELLGTALRECRETVLTCLKILGATYWLDRVGVNHKELSILKEHVIILRDGRVKIIDYETAGTGFGCNVCRAFSWLFVRAGTARRCCLNCSSFLVDARKILRDYKRGELSKFRDLVDLIIGRCLNQNT